MRGRPRTGSASVNPACFLVLALLLPGPARAQSATFGQNKVQYHQFRWSYYQTEHFDVYFTQGGDRIARFAARHIEDMYADVSRVVGHKLTARVPVILHNSHAEFEQTNVIRLPLHEGIGGFTEIFKNRVVLPFEGSYRDFHHVLKHELVHAVVFDMIFGSGAAGMVSRQAVYQFPLWVNEGLAEYTSLGWDLSSEFFMLDATTFGYVRSPVADFGGFLAYKGGQLFFHFMESVYGEGTVTRFIRALTGSRNPAEAFQEVTRTSLEEAGEIWLRELRHIYWPELGQRHYGKSAARQLTHHGKDPSFYNLQPSLSPDGKEIAYFSDRESWEAIYVLNVESEKVTRSVIRGGDKGRHESFHAFKSGIAWSPDGKRLAIVSKGGGKDVIHIIDARSGRVKREIAPPVEAILSPSWSRDGRHIAFSGMKEGLADIYVWDMAADSLRRLTHDIAHDDKPAFSPSGEWIAFESDRGTAELHAGDLADIEGFSRLSEYKDIYKISIRGDSLVRVAAGPYDEKMPAYGPADSLLLFVSNRSGIDNIYLSLDTGGSYMERPVTNLLSGCFTPSWSWDGKLMAFSLFERGGWDVFLMSDPFEKTLDGELPKTRFLKVREDTSLGFFRPLNWATLSSYKPDSAKGGAGKDAGEAGDSGTAGEKPSQAVGDSAAIGDPDSAASPEPAVSSRGSGGESGDSAAAGASGRADSGAAMPGAERSGESTAGKAGPFIRDSSHYLTEAGEFRKKRYRPRFSLDMVNAGLGFDNFYGAGGLAFVTLSDLMGDQEISFALNVNGDFDNMSAVGQYQFLPLKPDFSFLAHHQAFSTRNLQVQNAGIFYGDSIFLDRQWGVSAVMHMPSSVFSRWQLDLHTLFRSRTLQEETSDGLERVADFKARRISSFLPRISWVHDATLWGMVGPVNGQRFYLGLQTLLPVFQNEHAYSLLEADLRKYWQFGKKYTLAWRVSGGFSQAWKGYGNPHTFLVGGDEFNLFNPHYNPQNFPATIEEFHYSDLDVPLRGFAYYEFRGNRKFISNLEFRYPFIRELSIVWPLPLSIRQVAGSVFLDYGGAWSRGNALEQFGMGSGFGMRLNLGAFVLRWTRAWPIFLEGAAERDGSRRDYWSLGAEF